MIMDENIQNNEREEDVDRIIEFGSEVAKGSKSSIYTLTIIGQVEGHQVRIL